MSEQLSTQTKTRDEHLAWCKERAFQYCDKGDLRGALTSMISDLRKHPETADHSAIELGVMLVMGGHLGDAREMRHFIDGFR